MDPALIVSIGGAVTAAYAAIGVARNSGRANKISEKANDLAWVKELRADNVELRKEADQAREVAEKQRERAEQALAAMEEKIRELTRRLDVALQESDHWAGRHQLVQRIAFRPGVTLEQVREVIGAPPPNGAINGAQI